MRLVCFLRDSCKVWLNGSKEIYLCVVFVFFFCVLGVVVHSLNASEAESKCGFEPSVNETAEAVFERRWALTLLDRVLQLLEDEYQSKGRSEFFAACRGALIGAESSELYSQIAERHGMTEGAVKVAIHRMRTRYRELLRIEVSQTVASAEDIDDELRSLMAAVCG